MKPIWLIEAILSRLDVYEYSLTGTLHLDVNNHVAFKRPFSALRKLMALLTWIYPKRRFLADLVVLHDEKSRRFHT